MQVVKLLRYRDTTVEEYGRVMFNGKAVTCAGLSSVFERYLQLGIKEDSGARCLPVDGARFMASLPRLSTLFPGEIVVSDVSARE